MYEDTHKQNQYYIDIDVGVLAHLKLLSITLTSIASIFISFHMQFYYLIHNLHIKF